MPDGKALQAGTSHELGPELLQGVRHHVRRRGSDDQARLHDLVGHVVAHARRGHHGARRRSRPAHCRPNGADRGGDRADRQERRTTATLQKAREIAKDLKAAGYRVRVDDRDQKPGLKFAEWEMRGVPLRIEIGSKDLESGSVVVVRRDLDRGTEGQKTTVPVSALAAECASS